MEAYLLKKCRDKWKYISIKAAHEKIKAAYFKSEKA